MKKIFLLLFLIILSPVLVNAATYRSLRFADYTLSQGVRKQQYGVFGTDISINSGGTIGSLEFSSTDWRFRTDADTLLLSGAIIPLASDIAGQDFTVCNPTVIDESVPTVSYTCNSITSQRPKDFTFRVSILNTQPSRSYCDVNYNDGYFTASCPILSGTTDIQKITIEVLTGYNSGNSFFVGLAQFGTYLTPDNVTGAISDLSSSVSNASQNQITAANTNSQNQITNANTNSQNQINAANTNSQNQINAANQNSANEIAATNQNTAAVNNMNSTISNSEVDIDNSFFSGFDNNTHGLAGVITAPLQFIGSITSSTCSPLALPMGFGMPNVQLPCMREIYQQYFGEWYGLYRLITFGFVSYCISVQIFAIVKGLKDPENDKIEVMEL